MRAGGQRRPGKALTPGRLITVIGRGHGGTRAVSHALSASGVYMGALLNTSGDLVPAHDFYEACRVFARRVRHLGGLAWDFSRALRGAIDPAFVRLVRSYLRSVLDSGRALRGWKLPETVLALPWIVRMFPAARYIYWYRDPRDAILGGHLTDDLRDFGVPYGRTGDVLERRAVSWYYQWELMRVTPRPARVHRVRFEDFVLRHGRTQAGLERFLGFKLARLPVRRDSVGRWKRDARHREFDFLRTPMRRLGYLRT